MSEELNWGIAIIAATVAVFVGLFVWNVGVGLYRRRKGGWQMGVRTGIQVFNNRVDMLEAGWGLDSELKKVTSCWVVMVAGTHFIDMDQTYMNRIHRVLLMSPESPSISAVAKVSGYAERELDSLVTRATEIAKERCAKVQWYDSPPFSAVFGDPEDDKAWVRVRVFLPYVTPGSFPHLVVSKAENPELFNTLKNVFEGLWTQKLQPEKSVVAD